MEKSIEYALLQDSRYNDLFVVSFGKIEGVYNSVVHLLS